MKNVDAKLVDALTEIVRESSRFLEPFDVPTLVHGDLTFENVLWDGDQVTAIIDFEWARAAPADLDLDIILRFCAYPELHVAEDYLDQTKVEDYVDVPWWFREDYQELFAFPRALDRLRLYAISFDVRELLAFPPDAPAANLAPEHALNRLVKMVSGRSYLDNFAAPTRAGERVGYRVERSWSGLSANNTSCPAVTAARSPCTCGSSSSR